MRTRLARISFEDRKIIENELKKGTPQVTIAKMLGRCRSVICKEIVRGGGIFNYSAEFALDLRAAKYASSKKTMRIDERVELLEKELNSLNQRLTAMEKK